ncbi:MAG: PD-(D/E)XK nuclease family protein [Porticoccaceae bacterium]
MMRPLFDIASLREEIERGVQILTPNQRLASKIRQAWGMAQQQQNQSCWARPAVDAIESWLDEQWQRCLDLGYPSAAAGYPATPEVELMLWERAIETSNESMVDLAGETAVSLQPGNFARQAKDAYTIAQRWQMTDAQLTEEAPQLWRWVDAFRGELARHRLITPADKVSIICRAFREQVLEPLPQIHLCAFGSLSPLYLNLLEQASGTLTQQQPVKAAGQHACKYPCYGEQQELEAAVDWASAKQQADPEARIGIIIPELPKLRPSVERLLRQQLQPDYQHPELPRTPPPYNLSAGLALSETPLVSTALLLLELNRPQLPLETFCRILNNPFWTDTDPELRAEAELQLRKLAQLNPRSSEFRYRVSRVEERCGGTMSSRLEKFETLRREMPHSASYQQWLAHFSAQLDVLGWPGERTLDSIEYQQQQHWLNLLERYQQFDQLAQPATLFQALRQLQQLASNMVFQPETPDAAIQVLGLLEGAGLRFDNLWVMGLDDRRWPQPLTPNPLLPFALQRALKMPKSCPQQELQLAQAQLAGFLSAAPDVIFSFSQFDGDQPLQPSELISDIPFLNTDRLPGTSTQVPALAQLETVDCERAPPLNLADETIGGGTGIFRHQATCPFNAFAIHRLGARQPPQPNLGLSPLERGNLVHECLERLWRQLQNQQQLAALDDNSLRQLVSDTVRTTLQTQSKMRADLFGPAFTTIEQQRLETLLLDWLELEKTRPPFQVIELENTLHSEYAGIPLRMTIDRIDQLENGEQLVLDYKTGSASISRWLGERPEDPQMPLYLLTREQPTAAIAFAQISAGEQKFQGFAESAHLLPGVKTPQGKKGEPESWEALCEHWQQALRALGEEFKQGYAPVVFFSPTARRYQAELEPLNRAAELIAENDSEEYGS